MNNNFDNTKSKEMFHREMGTIIFYLNKILDMNKIQSKEQMLLFTLIKKIISNATAANILIYDDYYNEAKIILRSAIETVVLIAYLVQFPNKIDEYLLDSQIIIVKNHFIVYKSTRDGEKSDIDGFIYRKEELAKNVEYQFSLLSNDAKKKILVGTKLDNFVLNNETVNSIDKFFKTHRSFFQKLEDMYKELNSVNFKIGPDFYLRDILYYFYNDSSQVAHGCLYQWAKNQTFHSNIQYLFHYFIKVTLFLKVIIKDKLQLGLSNSTRKYVKIMEESTLKLEKLIYGRELDHDINVSK